MTHTYLGEFPVDIATSEFRDYTEVDWAMWWIGSYGQIDGSHHKQWTLDQVARILKGTPVRVVEARWQNADGSIETEYRPTLAEPSVDYLAWVDDMKGEWDDEEEMWEYDYDTGVAP